MGGGGPDLDVAGRGRHAAEPRYALDVHEDARPDEAFLHEQEQLGAAGVEGRRIAVFAEERADLAERRRPAEVERADHPGGLARRGAGEAPAELVERLLRLALDDALAEASELAQHLALRPDRQPGPGSGRLAIDRHAHGDLRADERVAAPGGQRQVAGWLGGEDLDVERHREADRSDLLRHARAVAAVGDHFLGLGAAGQAGRHARHVPEDRPERLG